MAKAVISGSASGIGACVRMRLEKQGFDVTGIDIKDAEVVADLSTAEGRQEAIDGAMDLTGGCFDVLVLAAGLGGHLDDGQLVAKVNYYGAIDLLDGFRDALASTKGRCVVISSNSAQMGTDPQSPIIANLLDGSETGVVRDIDSCLLLSPTGLHVYMVLWSVQVDFICFGS